MVLYCLSFHVMRRFAVLLSGYLYRRSIQYVTINRAICSVDLVVGCTHVYLNQSEPYLVLDTTLCAQLCLLTSACTHSIAQKQ